jgi:hypothetical protein
VPQDELSVFDRPKQDDCFYWVINNLNYVALIFVKSFWHGPTTNNLPNRRQADKPAQARIVGKIAKVSSPHGTLEFSRWYDTERKAKLAVTKKRKVA